MLKNAFGIITQNVDGLHQKAGCRSLQEILDTIWKNYCASHLTEYDADYIFDSTVPVPHYPLCNGIVRSDVTLFEKRLSQEAYSNAIYMINAWAF